MPRISFGLAATNIQKAFDETSYASFSALCVDVVKGTQKKYSKDEANNEVLKQCRRIAGVDENKPSAFEVKRALNKTVVREAIFEVISETINDTLVSGWEDDPYFNQFVEYKSLALGDTNSFYVTDTTPIVISEVAASNHDLIRQRLGVGREVSVTVKNYSAKVYIEAERFLMGVEDWTGMIAKISLAFTNMIKTLIHNSVLKAGASLPSPTQWNLTMQLTEANRMKLVKLISDVQSATGTQPVIMGTTVALDGLTNMIKSDIFSAQAKEDVYSFGRIGHFGPTPIVEIPQRFELNDTSKYLYDDKKLFVMPGNIDKFIKMYDEGDIQITEVSTRDAHVDHTYDYEVTRKMGVATLVNTRFGAVTIGE